MSDPILDANVQTLHNLEREDSEVPDTTRSTHAASPVRSITPSPGLPMTYGKCLASEKDVLLDIQKAAMLRTQWQLNEDGVNPGAGIAERLSEVERWITELFVRVARLDGGSLQEMRMEALKINTAQVPTIVTESKDLNSTHDMKDGMIEDMLAILEQRVQSMVRDAMFDEQIGGSRRKSMSTNGGRSMSGLRGSIRGSRSVTMAPMTAETGRGVTMSEIVSYCNEDRGHQEDEDNDRQPMGHEDSEALVQASSMRSGSGKSIFKGDSYCTQSLENVDATHRRGGSIHVDHNIESKTDGRKSVSSSETAGTVATVWKNITATEAAGAVENLCKETQDDGVPILDAEANEKGAQDWIYDWNETIWDAMPFVGLGVMTRMDTMLVIFIAVLNLTIQAAFIGLVGANMTGSPFEAEEIIDTLTDWRVSYAHNPNFADKYTSQSLGAGVCDESEFLMQGATQAIMYSNIVAYINAWLGMASGGCLCMLSVFLWTMTCCKELKRISLFCVGLWTPNDGDQFAINHSYVEVQERSVIWVYGEATQKNFQVFFTIRRTVLITLMIVMPRLSILGGLSFVGTRFLTNDFDLKALVLNCVALEIVLNVDDLLFHIFVPDSALRMVRKTKPLRIPKLRGSLARVVPWLRICAALSWTGLIYIYMLRPLILVMRDVAEVMCGGDVDFLASEMAFGGIVVGMPTTSRIQRTSYPYRAIHQRTNLKGDKNQVPLYIEGTVFGFEKVQTLDRWTDRQLIDWASLDISDPTLIPCAERFYVRYKGMSPSAFWAGISHAVGKQASNCDDLAQFCNDQTKAGGVSRLFCPTSCGAEDPLSGMMAIIPADGVPSECRPWFAVRLVKMPCHDQPFHLLANASHPMGQAWRRWEETMMQLATPVIMSMALGNHTHFLLLASIVKTGMLAEGCDFFKRLTLFPQPSGKVYAVNFCDTKDERLFGRLSMRSFCPVACGCPTGVKRAYENAGETWDLRTGRESQCPASCWMQPPVFAASFGVSLGIAMCMQPPPVPAACFVQQR